MYSASSVFHFHGHHVADYFTRRLEAGDAGQTDKNRGHLARGRPC